MLREGVFGDKNQYKLFVRIEVFEYFSYKNFFKKSNIFQNSKQFFWGGGGGRGMTIVQGMGFRAPKMNITFSRGNGMPNMASKLKKKKTPYGLNESPKTSFGKTFSPISVVEWDRLLSKKK